jgi:hypothetical protein
MYNVHSVVSSLSFAVVGTALIQTSNEFITDICPSSNLWFMLLVSMTCLLVIKVMLSTFPKFTNPTVEIMLFVAIHLWGLYELINPCVNDVIRKTPVCQLVVGITFCCGLCVLPMHVLAMREQQMRNLAINDKR